MCRTSILVLVLCFGCSAPPVPSSPASNPVSANESSRAALKRQAEAMRDATARRDSVEIIDRTHPSVVAAYGGRDQAIQKISLAMEQMNAQLKANGMSEAVLEIGESGDFYTEGANTFAVVPTSLEIRFKGGVARNKAYLLAVSSDGGKVWTFIDSGGIQDPKFREQVLPKFPPGMTLPELKKSEITPDK